MAGRRHLDRFGHRGLDADLDGEEEEERVGYETAPLCPGGDAGAMAMVCRLPPPR